MTLDVVLVPGETGHNSANKLHAFPCAVTCGCVMHAEHEEPGVNTLTLAMYYAPHSTPRELLHAIGDSWQRESSASARFKRLSEL